MIFNPEDLTKPLEQARKLEESNKYDESLKKFLNYYKACVAQKEYGLKSLSVNLDSALKGATRCLIKMDKLDDAKNLLKEQLSLFRDEFKNSYFALMRSKIENILFNLLTLETSIDNLWSKIDDYLSEAAFEKMDSRFRKSGRISFYLTDSIDEVIGYYREIFAKEAAKNLLDSVIFKVKSKMKNSVSWEPQFFADVATKYTFFDFYKEAIDLSLFAYELTRKYSDDVPQNFRLVEGDLIVNLIDWHLILNNFNECEKWVAKIFDKRPEHAGYQYLKMKRYNKAKECFEKSITKNSHDLPFIYELINFCDTKVTSKTNEKCLRNALTIYENRDEKSPHNIGINKLRIFRVKDSLGKFDKKRYMSFIDDLKEKALFKDTKYSPYPLTFYFGMMGICYLKLENREYAFKSFDKIKEIEKAEEDVNAWEYEPEYVDFYWYVREEMILREIYDDKYRDINSPDKILKFVFTDEEFEKFSGKTKKEYFKEGIQREPGEITTIIKVPF